MLRFLVDYEDRFSEIWLLLNQHIQRQLEMTSHVEFGDIFHSSVHAMLMDAEAYVQLNQSPLFKNRLPTNENNAQEAAHPYSIIRRKNSLIPFF